MSRPRTLLVPFTLAAAVAATALVVTLWGTFHDVQLRPLDGVEGDLLFEASRIRSGLPLWVDPSSGAHDYGAIPARWFVLYPPLWAAWLSMFPSAWAAAAGRLSSCAAFWGLLAAIVWTAAPPARGRAALAAAFVGGVHALAEFGGTARPDAAAIALAGVALVRVVRRGEIDSLAGALFALAAWTKPNVVGMAAGVFVVSASFGLRDGKRGVVGACSVSLLLAALLQGASGGAWAAHVLAGTGQPLHLRLLVHHLAARAQFFAFFLALAAFFAASRARATSDVAERAKARLALGGLAGATVWALVTFAKTGSAANYWLEPCVAAVVTFAHVPAPDLSRRAGLALAAALPLQALWTGVGSIGATLESVDASRAHAELVAGARSACRAPPDGLVVADEPGIEMMLDGRLIAHPFPLGHQVLRGRLDPAGWIADLGRPEIACVVTMHDRIERPPSEVDEDYDYFAPPVRAALAARFAPVRASAGWEVYAPRAEEPARAPDDR